MPLLKWAGIAVGGVFVLLVAAYGYVYVQTESRLNRDYAVDVAPVLGTAFAAAGMDGKGMWDGGAVAGEEGGVSADSDSDMLEWGEHLAVTRGCGDCHGEDLGGAVFADEMPVMRLSASNLTPGGVGAGYSDEDWIRAIRHGVGPDGKPLLFMPSYEYFYLSDSDVAALVAYLKTLPAVSREVEENKVGPVGRLLFMAGKLPLVPAEMIDHDAPRPTAPPRGASVAYGEYLAVGCTGCHGPEFSGGPIPGVPPNWPKAANITQDPETGIGSWTRSQFMEAFTEGRRPDGRELQGEFMPWPNFAQFEADEREAIWMYLQTVRAKPYGGR